MKIIKVKKQYKIRFCSIKKIIDFGVFVLSIICSVVLMVLVACCESNDISIEEIEDINVLKAVFFNKKLNIDLCELNLCKLKIFGDKGKVMVSKFDLNVCEVKKGNVSNIMLKGPNDLGKFVESISKGKRIGRDVKSTIHIPPDIHKYLPYTHKDILSYCKESNTQILRDGLDNYRLNNKESKYLSMPIFNEVFKNYTQFISFITSQNMEAIEDTKSATVSGDYLSIPAGKNKIIKDIHKSVVFGEENFKLYNSLGMNLAQDPVTFKVFKTYYTYDELVEYLLKAYFHPQLVYETKVGDIECFKIITQTHLKLTGGDILKNKNINMGCSLADSENKVMFTREKIVLKNTMDAIIRENGITKYNSGVCKPGPDIKDSGFNNISGSVFNGYFLE